MKSFGIHCTGNHQDGLIENASSKWKKPTRYWYVFYLIHSSKVTLPHSML